MFNKLGNFFRSSFYEKINKIEMHFAKFKTKYYYAIYMKGLGKGSIIKNPLLLANMKYMTIGNNVFIRDGVRMEAVSSYENKTLNPNIIIEDGVSFQQRCHITATDTMIIGKNTLISFDVSIQDSDHEYEDLTLPVANQPLSIKKTNIGENCFIGSGVKIQAGTVLGKHCVVGTNAVVRGVFPDYCVIVGIPAKIVKRYDENSKKWRKTNNKGDFQDEI